ncbi:hypothetical protein B7R54_04350 [Subtercola boreus]|uniref:Periplasmic binding protein domain-containing protein n=1 Tax=Subtercola boreus TaxID=120213 RepID=A0A3E0VFN6_9MICO|nr:hypothetical protein B7R54_04350 [Subtercola boreus]
MSAADCPQFDSSKAHYTTPPTTPNPAAKQKNIAIVAVGMSSPTVAVGAAGVEAAITDIGWQYTLYDAKLDPSAFSTLVRQAITNKADGIIGVGLDAPLVKAAIEEATAAGIPSISVQGWDLDQDPDTSTETPVFSTRISFGDRFPDFADVVRASAADAADYLTSKAGCSGTILDFSNNEYTTLKLINQGFTGEMSTNCPNCKVVDVPWTASQFGPELTGIAKAAILKNPDVKAIQAGTNPQLGITQAIVQSGYQDKVSTLGGFGLAADFAVSTQDQGLNATTSWPVEWWSYAAVDTLNSYFNKTEPVDEGLGWKIVDKASGFPDGDSDFKPPFDVPAAYKLSWGVSN